MNIADFILAILNGEMDLFAELENSDADTLAKTCGGIKFAPMLDLFFWKFFDGSTLFIRKCDDGDIIFNDDGTKYKMIERRTG